MRYFCKKAVEIAQLWGLCLQTHAGLWSLGLRPSLRVCYSFLLLEHLISRFKC